MSSFHGFRSAVLVSALCYNQIFNVVAKKVIMTSRNDYDAETKAKNSESWEHENGHVDRVIAFTGMLWAVVHHINHSAVRIFR